MPLAPRVVGLLGGSSNPAHAGHVHISVVAKKALKLDQVWWLVSPQNPLKSADGMAHYAERLAAARQVAAMHPFIAVSAAEQQLGTRYTVDTLEKLMRRYPHTRFIWLMGADNLRSFHHWKKWVSLFSLTPIAVFDRAPYSHSALKSHAALRFAAFRQREPKMRLLAAARLPAWGYIHMRRHPLSASLLRKKLGKDTIFGHNKG